MDWNWDVDLISNMQIEKIIKSEGYDNIRCIWYWNSKFSFALGLKPLNNDKDVLTFIEDVKGFKVVYIYVEHNVHILEIIYDMVEQVNVEKVNALVYDVNVNDDQDNDVEVGGNAEDDESKTNPDYEESGEYEDESEIDHDLGPDVSVDSTKKFPNEQTKHSSKHNVISNKEGCDSDELHTPS
ncbi:unnamed protein product [Vicia faba]|uniref:PB1-like domain-containing protein n=1 Tax=Vicia faba TaxID=3906 RepID=A0AAV1ABU2_VICFA|nr:unnamed protein product [Vicia faba]